MFSRAAGDTTSLKSGRSLFNPYASVGIEVAGFAPRNVGARELISNVACAQNKYYFLDAILSLTLSLILIGAALENVFYSIPAVLVLFQLGWACTRIRESSSSKPPSATKALKYLGYRRLNYFHLLAFGVFQTYVLGVGLAGESSAGFSAHLLRLMQNYTSSVVLWTASLTAAFAMISTQECLRKAETDGTEYYDI